MWLAAPSGAHDNVMEGDLPTAGAAQRAVGLVGG
jgi:hypothetical protein